MTNLKSEPPAVISVILPVFNEEETLPHTFAEISRFKRDEREYSWEFIFVDDGSSDSSSSLILEEMRNQAEIRLVTLSRNFGHQPAILAGLEEATGDLFAIVDSDLQDPLFLVPKMAALLESRNLDSVAGVRIRRTGETAAKRWLASSFYAVIDALTDFRVPGEVGDFRVISDRARTALLSIVEPGLVIRVAVHWLGLREELFPYERASRLYGKTKYPLIKQLGLGARAVVNFSAVPLRLIFVGAAVTASGAMAYLFWVLFRFFNAQPIEGWSSVMVVMLGLGTVHMLSLAVIAAYLARIWSNSNRFPPFVKRSSD